MSRITINSNIASFNAQRHFGNATKNLSESFTRLSSGLRINRAVDDAAGLSISESLKADTRIFNQGIRNLNDGVSLLAIADGALGELSGITTRLRELATQSANGTLSNKQRISIDKEAQSLSKEYNRIARTTSFNNQTIFDGDFGVLSLAAGGGRETLIQNGLGGAIGDGSFKASVSYYSSPLGDRLGDVADFNGDGIQDILSTNYGNGTASIFLGKGDGTFKAASTYNVQGSPFEIRAGDMDGDGILDLVSADTSQNTLSFLKGNGDGSFKARVTIAAGANAYSIEIGDLNNDGILDIASSSITASTVSIFLGNGNGTFKRSDRPLSYGSYTAQFGDFDGDGNLDMVTQSASFALVGVHLGNGDGTFKVQKDYYTGGAVNGSTMVRVGDVNGDGIEDLVTANATDLTLSVLIGRGDGTFNNGITFATTGTNLYDVKIGDFNGDGHQDLVSAEIGTATLGIFLGNGNGTFKSRVSYATSTAGGVLVGDFNNDGVLDLAAANTYLHVHLGNANQGVSALQAFSLRTQKDAKSAMTYLENVLNRVSKQRGQIGAFQSRVDVAVNTLKTSSLNYSEANSRITDADVAEESSRLVRNQILQKSAASVLAQANQQPQITLALLRNA